MTNETYSVQALIVDHGKNIKGTLVLSLDKYEFNGITRAIDWEKAFCITGTSIVKRLLIPVKKPHIVIGDGADCSPAFVMSQSQVGMLESKIAEFADIVKQNRLAREERMRQREEKWKHREEYEQKLREKKNRRFPEERELREEDRYMNLDRLFRQGDVGSLAAEFIQKSQTNMLGKFDKLEDPLSLREKDILAVHFADGGAQGDAGAVEILCITHNTIKALYGNYLAGDLNLDNVIRVLPMLKCLDSRYSYELPYPFGGEINVPEGWKYMYMGAMNHLFVREKLAEASLEYLNIALSNTGKWNAFNAIAWFCGVE